jgi:hypothetical protein
MFDTRFDTRGAASNANFVSHSRLWPCEKATTSQGSHTRPFHCSYIKTQAGRKRFAVGCSILSQATTLTAH